MIVPPDRIRLDLRYSELVPIQLRCPILMATFLTIGHSNRSLNEMIEMLREAQTGIVADVRAFPRSRTNPAFNIDAFGDALAGVQIGYRHFPSLGGRKPKQKAVDESINAFWRIQSFHNYADYALGSEFHAALKELELLGRDVRVALMCSEAVWWRCHRRIIADYLLLGGHDVFHIMSPGRCDLATPSPTAVKTPDGKVAYPPAS